MPEQENIEILADHVEKIACANCKHHLDISSLPIFTLFNCPECHAQQMVPGKLGNFILLEELGRGGMGAVYRGQDLALGRPVAIKVMHKSLGDDPQFLDNFLREARAAAAINHKNVVQIFSFGREKGQPYLIMELVDGGRLDTYITSSQPLTEIRALEICHDVAEGLKAAHDVGLMHGDVKPANILFDEKGTAKVADFGLASFIHLQKAGSNDIWGTPFYIAPEKARRQRADQRADIYSLGATMFHAMTIKPPFDGETPTEVVLARLQLPPPDISTTRQDLQPETVRIINRMLAADPAMRYPNYTSLIADLQEAKAKLTGDGPAADHKATKSSSKAGLYLTVGGLALVAIGAAVWTISAKNKKPEAPAPIPAVVATSTASVIVTNVALVPKPTDVVQDAVSPFNTADSKRIISIVQPLGHGEVPIVSDKLESMHLHDCTNQVQRYWLQLFQALALQVDRRNLAAGKLLAALPAPPPATTNVTDEATRIPLLAAQFLQGKIDEGGLETINKQAPEWCSKFIHFIEGWRIWTTMPLRTDAVGKFRGYQLTSSGEPEWPFAFKPLTDNWLKQYDDFNKIAPKFHRYVTHNNFTEARKLLTDFRAKCGVLQFNMTENATHLLVQAEQDAKATPVETTPKTAAPVSTPQPKPVPTLPPAEPKPEPIPAPAPLIAAWASSETKTDPARWAIDGNYQTRWVSQYRDNQWLAVDLGREQKITGVVIYWDAARAVDYKIQVSRDRAFWTDALKVNNSPGGRDVKTFKAATGRYVRIYSLIREFKHPNIAVFEVQVLVNDQKPPPPPAQ